MRPEACVFSSPLSPGAQHPAWYRVDAQNVLLNKERSMGQSCALEVLLWSHGGKDMGPL
jgi:hypothetical protein